MNMLAHNINYDGKITTIGGIDFVDTLLLSSALWDIADFLKWKLEYEQFEFDGKRELYRVFWNYFIVKYSDQNLRNRDKDKLMSAWKFDKFWRVDKDENWVQVPKTDFVVDHEWNYYLMIKATRRMDEYMTDVEKWVFKSMVVDLDKYIGVSSETKQEVDDVRGDIDGIIKDAK